MLTIFDLVDVSENINLIEIIDFAIIFFSDLIITLKFKSLLNKLSLLNYNTKTKLASQRHYGLHIFRNTQS